MNKVSYKFTPSLLDAFQTYLDSEALYEKFYGFSEEPALTFQEYEVKQLGELIDKINRVPFESEAADKGSCINEVVDCLVLKKNSTRDDILVKTLSSFERLCEDGAWDMIENKPLNYECWFEKIKQPCIYARKGEREFYLDINFCRGIADYFHDSLCQVYTEAPIETEMGTVLLYGYPDYVRGDMVYDLKTTSKYEFGKYSKYWQQHVYPWTLIESGKCKDIRAFEFTAYQLRGGTAKLPLIYGERFPEVYVYDHRRSTGLLKNICTQFALFLENHRDEITDKKIFGGEKV